MEGTKNMSEQEVTSICVKTDRDLEEYKKLLHFTDSDIEGKRVLDLGSGSSCNFTKDVNNMLPSTEVISFDFSFNGIERSLFGPEKTGADQERSKQDLQNVEGLFTKLPFSNDSFDVVVSCAAMPLYLSTSEKVCEGFQEVVRILKSGGKAFIGPVTYLVSIDPLEKHSVEEGKKLFEEILKKMEGQVKYEFIPEETRYKIGSGEMEKIVTRPAALILTKK
jgi:ubiquinone/menaquinone biosynthesis C-methylase UbiE